MKSLKTIFFFNDFLNNLICFAAPNIKAKQLIYELHRSRFFLFGLIIRSILILISFPLLQRIWFVEFINNNLNQFSINPWHVHLNSGGDILAFPYGYVMYAAYLPFTFLGFLIDKYFDIYYFSKIGFGITTLFFDYGILISISLLLKKSSLLLSYFPQLKLMLCFYCHIL